MEAREPIERRKLVAMLNAIADATDAPVLTGTVTAPPENGDLKIQVAICVAWPPGATKDEVLDALELGVSAMRESIDRQADDP